jgi:hypothetical protein
VTSSIRSALRASLLALPLVVGLSCKTSPTENGGVQSDFVLNIRFLGTAPTGATLAAFENAETTILQTITGALSTVGLPVDFTNLADCGAEFAGFPDIARDPIQGLDVYVLIDEIDDLGGTLGSAGPCLIRANDIPALGVMLLDEADVQNLVNSGNIGRVVLHEMMHILGFGTVWTDKALVDATTDPANARYLGANARAACAGTNGGGTACATTVPVHSTGGAGTQYTHWRESYFVNELMTPFLNPGVANPFSATSLRSLADLGYVVSNDAAEAFTISGTELRAAAPPSGPVIEFGEPIQPRWRIDGSGKRVPYRQR